MKNQLRFILSAVSITMMLVSACSRPQKKPAKPPATVVAHEVSTRTVRSELTLTGTIEPDRSARLAAQVDGEVIALKAREGTHVLGGQVLLIIDPSRLQAALHEAEADLMGAQAQLEDGLRVLERDRKLFERRGISKERLEESETNVSRLKAASLRAQAKIDGIQTQLADTRVKAPFKGYILERSVELGDVVKSGAPLFILASESLHALVSISQKHLFALKEGDMVRLNAHNNNGKSRNCPGTIRLIRPRIDPATRTAEIEIVPQPGSCDIRWLPGMLTRVTFTLDESGNTLAVPAGSITRHADGKSSLFVVEENVARKRMVETGLEGGGWIVISSGLREKERVIVQGFEKLKDGSRVSATAIKPGNGKPSAKAGAESEKSS